MATPLLPLHRLPGPIIRLLFSLMSLWPPFLGAGVRVKRLAGPVPGFRTRMSLLPWNRNFVGTHFGGSLSVMTDPFYMLLLLEQLGPGYVVWDKAATIRFRRPGRGRVEAVFRIPPERVAEIRQAADRDGKTEPAFTVEVLDREGLVVAEVEKLLYVRRRGSERPGGEVPSG